MNEQYWQEVVRLMRAGLSRTLAHDMARNALRLRQHFEVIAIQRRNEAA